MQKPYYDQLIKNYLPYAKETEAELRTKFPLKDFNENLLTEKDLYQYIQVYGKGIPHHNSNKKPKK